MTQREENTGQRENKNTHDIAMDRGLNSISVTFSFKEFILSSQYNSKKNVSKILELEIRKPYSIRKSSRLWKYMDSNHAGEMKSHSKKATLSSRVVLRYSLFQLPEIAVVILVMATLRVLLNIPMWSIWTFIIFWIAKDIIMFPFVRDAYDKWNTSSAGALIGLQGKVVEALSPSGYVKVRGELWRAEAVKEVPRIDKGDIIEILGSRGYTLIVQSQDHQEQ